MFHGLGPDNPVIRFLSRIADLLILNILFLICCVPVITIGASCTALYSVTLKMVKNEEGSMISGFLHDFRKNFRFGTLSWMFVLAIGTVLWIIYCFLSGATLFYKPLLYIAFTVALILFLFFTIYIFPCIARFENTWKDTLKNAFLLSLVQLPYTVLLLAIFVIVIVVTIYVDFRITGLFWILIGFSGVAFVNSFLLRRVFQKFEDRMDNQICVSDEEMK